MPDAESPAEVGGERPVREFERLGTGSSEDRLGFSEVLRIFARSLPLLWPVRGHLIALIAMVVAGVAMVFPIALAAFDATWQGVLQGVEIQETTARLLWLDPVAYSQPELSTELRSRLRDHLFIGLWLLGALSLPVAGAGYYYLIWILQRINHLLRARLVERLQSLSLRFHSDARVGDSIYRTYQDSSMVTNVIRTLIIEPTLRLVFLGVVALQVARYIDARLALFLALTFPPSLWLGYRLSARMRVGFRASREANSALTSRIQETLAGLRVIKAFGAEPTEQRRFEADSRTAFAHAFSARNRLAWYGVLLFWISGTVVLCSTFAATRFTMEGAALTTLGVWLGLSAAKAWDLGLYNAFKDTGTRVASGIEGLFSLWGRAQDIAIGLDRVYQVLDLEPEIVDATDAVAMPPVRDKIRFEQVSFAYRPDQPILHKVDLEARPGTITAFVGPTGSGKSTLLSLLLRLYDPDEGRIEIDGVDLRAIRVQSLRDHVAIALQENVLFGTTVRENIRYAVPDASDDQVREAARVACAHDFISRLSSGYDTLLGERGSKLSTGQRQRISIARAILKNAPVLILDEPTAALDAETEMAVLRNLAAWGRERTIFLITHRLSTIRRADQIVVLREGEVVERGSHDLLMARGGVYARLFELESEWSRSA